MAEQPAVAGVEVALRPHALGEQQVVRIQLDMMLVDGGAVVVTSDGSAVQQTVGGDQYFFNQ